MEIRLNKFLAERLGLSRREADEAISHGKVKIDGKTAVLGDRISLASLSGGAHGRVTPPEGVPRDVFTGEETAAGPVKSLV